MLRERPISALALFGMLAWLAGPGGHAAQVAGKGLSEDEKALQQAGVALDSANLVDYFRRRTPGEEQQALLKQRTGQLGSTAYTVRVKATDDLIRAGRASLPVLRETAKSPDAEMARRAQYCIKVIEQNTRLGLSALVARVLAERQTAGAGEAMLAYLPFVDENWVEEDIRQSLRKLALVRGKAAEFLVTALTAAEPKRRGAAAWIVGQSEDAEQRLRVVARLNDDVPDVRFLAASSLLTSRESVAVPALIGLLADAPADIAWRSEDLLVRLAGVKGPTVWLDVADDNNDRKVQAAWQAWWKSAAPTIDWKSLRLEEHRLGLTLVAENQRVDGGGGRIYECDSTGQIRWQVRVANPIDVQWLPGGRILVADSRSSLLYEMDARGVVGWKLTGISPTSCQRLPNGNTVVSTYQSIIEVNREGKILFTHSTQGHTYHARKLPDGHYIWLDASGEIVEINEAGQELARTKLGSGLTWGSIERLRNGHYLVALGGINKVQEIDIEGRVYWEKVVNNPNRAIRLANGNILVASHGDQCIYEFDSQGNERWKHDCASRPFAVQRR